MYKLNNLSITKKQRRELRKQQTHAEAILWSKLRGNQIGYKFRRQHSFGKYIMDFYCSTIALDVELDGNVHEKPSQKLHDEGRRYFLEEHFITVIRFTNQEVYNDADRVVRCIKEKCCERETFFRHFTPSNSPLAEGELKI